jgi:hypothetical protein
MKAILAFAAAGLLALTLISGLTPVAPADKGFAKKCSREQCRARCTGRCDIGMCEMCKRR